MCYAIPGKVEAFVGENRVLIDYFGEKKLAINELDEVRIGDYVYAQGGYVIETLPPDYAESVLDLWKESFFRLQELDLSLSRAPEAHTQNQRLLRILDKAFYGKDLDRDDLLYLIHLEDPQDLEYLYRSANFLRHKYTGNSCCVHGIIEVSNRCTCACKYCGISVHNRRLPRYQMSVEEVKDLALSAIDRYGFKALVLQSGEGLPLDYYVSLVRAILEERSVFLCVSFGEVGLEGLEALFAAGARGLLMRFETSNPALYRELHPGKELSSRLEHIRHAREIGFLVFTGALVGLPGQTLEDIVNDILLARELSAEMYSFGPFIPHQDTPLAEARPPDPELMLKTLAVMRMADYRQGRILVTTAFETLDSKARERGLMAGANSIMLNITPIHQRRSYAIYPNRAWRDEKLETQIDEAISLLQSLGRAPTDLGVKT